MQSPLVDCFQWFTHELNGLMLVMACTSTGLVLPVVCLASTSSLQSPLVDCFQWLAHELNCQMLVMACTSTGLVLPVVCLASTSTSQSPLVDCFQWLTHELNCKMLVMACTSTGLVLPVVCLASEERRKAGNLLSQYSSVAGVVMRSLCGIAIVSYVCVCVCVCVCILSTSRHPVTLGECSRISCLRNGLFEIWLLQLFCFPPCGLFQTLCSLRIRFWNHFG